MPKKKLYPRGFVREDLGSSLGSEKVPIFSPKMFQTKFLQSVCKWYQSIEEGLNYLEPVEQNAHLFACFTYDRAKLPKNPKKPPVLYKVNGSKVIFFNRKMFQTKFLQSLRQLDCWIANRLNYTNPVEQN